MTDIAPLPPRVEPDAPQPHGTTAGPGCCSAGPSRREVLAGLGVLGAAATLAACGPSSPAPVVVEDGPAGAVARTSDVPVGRAVSAQLDDTALLVAQPEEGVFVGFNARCPHEGCRVAPDGGELSCPCHGSTFELDGSLVRGPAQTGLVPVTVRVEGDFLVAELG